MEGEKSGRDGVVNLRYLGTFEPLLQYLLGALSRGACLQGWQRSDGGGAILSLLLLQEMWRVSADRGGKRVENDGRAMCFGG